MSRTRLRRGGYLGSVAAALALTVGLVAAPLPASAVETFPWDNKTLSADERAELLLNAMSFDQKMVLFNSTPTPVPELKIPPRREVDGCCGVVVTDQAATGLPAGLSLASTFNTDLAETVGDVVGSEAWSLGYAGVGSPAMDLTRSPWSGRQNESYGEDPLVSGRMGAGQISGIQQNSVYANVKHFLMNDQESRRTTVNEIVDGRTLNEFYAKPWEIAIDSAPMGAAMCAFPKINWEYACGNDETLNGILKDRLGFEGFVSSDYDALHSLQDYVNGADVGSPTQFMAGHLRAAVLNGTVPMDRFNNMVFRILRTFFATGVYDNPAPGLLTFPHPTSSPISGDLLNKHEEVARQVAREGAVLLKNSENGLPLEDEADSIAVIGSDADWYIAGSNGFTPEPARLTTILDGITARAGADVNVSYSPGTDPVRLGDTLPGLAPVPSVVLSPAPGSTEKGLTAQYFQNPEFAGEPFTSRKEDQVNVRNGLSSLIQINSTQIEGVPLPVAFNPFSSWRYIGTLTAPETGSYTLELGLLGSGQLFVDGNEIVTADTHSYATSSATLDLVAGETYDIRIDYRPDAPNQFTGSLGDAPMGMLRFGWQPPSAASLPQIQQAVEAAKTSDVAVIVARDYSGEMADRGTLSLPQAQDTLIREVAKVNPHTIVVLATGGPVLMPWLDEVEGVLEMWYPGEAQGKAAADLLFGDYSPSGKLPISFPLSEQQPAAIGITNSFGQHNDVNPTATHDEGVFVGYRGYTANAEEPLFPFGHGLTYSTTTLTEATVRNPQAAVGPSAAKPGAVTVRITNTGTVASNETVQVYSGALPTAAVDTPPRQLVGWADVTLNAGESRSVSVPIDVYSPEHPLSYFDEATNAWFTPAGPVDMFVGTSLETAVKAGAMQVPDSTPISVTPTGVEFNDERGTTNDTYTIPATDGVEYIIGDKVVIPGTYTGAGKVTVTARAVSGYVLAEGAVSEWTQAFSSNQSYAPPATSPFADISTTQLYYKEMAWLAEEEISTGWTETDGTRTYRALQPINRDAMAAFLYRAAGSPDYMPPTKSPFADISTTQLYYKEMAWLAEEEISTGWTETDGTRTYRALQPINRDAMAAFLYRAAGSPDYMPPTESPFADISTTQLYYKEMAWLAEEEISTGWTETDGTRTYRALQPINRDAMAAFLYRAAGEP